MAYIGTILLILGLISVWTAGAYSVEVTPELPELDFKYHDQQELKKYLTAVSLQYPNLTSLYVIGKSHRNHELLVLNISAALADKVGVPNVKLLANIHGNEPVGREVALHFIQFLVTNYSSNSTVQWFLNNTRIHILANVNPDGFQKSGFAECAVNENGRGNLRGIDLNRNFPDYFRKNTKPKQPETLAIMKWMNETVFTLSASLHSGALVANYPFENTPEDITDATPKAFPSPDDDVFKHLAIVYSSTHPTMHKGIQCSKNGKKFENGIVNGAEWFKITGGMQDFNYVWHGCMELTLELACCKYPHADTLPSLWKENKEALLKYFTQAHYGVQGLVFDNDDHKPIPGANLFIEGRNFSFRSSKRGEFWRILLPGNYTLQVNLKGYENESIPFVVNIIEDGVPPSMTWLNVSLISSSSLSKRKEDDDLDAQAINASQTPLPRTVSTEFVTPAPQVKKCRKLGIDKEEEARRAAEAYEILKKCLWRDEFSTFGEHVANEIRKFSWTAQTMVKYHINNVLFDAAMGKFDAPPPTHPFSSHSNQSSPRANPTPPTPRCTPAIPTYSAPHAAP